MRNRGVVVAVIVACFGCFSTARYDRAHTQRVSTIQARYDADLARERQRHAVLVAELERRRAFLVSLLASPQNELLLAEIDRQSTVLAERHARARHRIEQARQRELQASQQQRTSEIEAGRAARRARVRAAADAFAAEARGQPTLAPATSERSTTAPSISHSEPDCDGASCPAPAPAAQPTTVTCIPGAPEMVSQTSEPSSRNRIASGTPLTRLTPLEPLTPLECFDDADCPGDMSCDPRAGVCCTNAVR